MSNLPNQKTPNDFPFKHSGQADAFGDSQGGNVATIQTKFDERAIFNQDQINEVLISLGSNDGAKQIFMSAVAGLVSDGDNVQEAVVKINDAIMQVISDGITPGVPGYFLRTNKAGTSVEWAQTNNWVKPVSDNTIRIDELAVNAGISSVTGPNSEVYYDYKDSGKLYTAGTVDRTKAYCETVSQGVNTVSVTSMINNTFSDFEIGQQITLQDDTSKEDLTILLLSDPLITFSSNIVNTYASGANVYRSNITDDWEFGGFGKGLIGFDLSDASYDSKNFDASTQGTTGYHIYIKPDGTKMYHLSDGGNAIYQYTLPTPWDVSTATYDSKSFSVATQDNTPRSISLNEDGTILFVLGRVSDTIYEYDLSVAWDISTATYNSASFNLNTQIAESNGMYVREDGLRLFVTSGTDDTVYQYSLSSAWDISTASYDSKSFDLSTQISTPVGISLSSDGKKMFVISGITVLIFEYDLSTPWDVSTAVYNSVSFDLSPPTSAGLGVFFKPDGIKMYISDVNTSIIYQFTTGVSDITNLTDIDIRVNIEAFTDKQEISAFLEINDFDTVTLDGFLSIHANGANETYIDTTDVKIDEDTNNMYLSTGTVVTPEKQATMKYELTRASTGDAVVINRVQGGLL